MWSGDATFWKQRSRYDDTLLNGRVQAATPLGSYTYNTLSGSNVSLTPIPYVGGYYATSGRAYGVTLGVPNLASVGVGEVKATKPSEYARGPYVGIGGSIHLGGPFHVSLGVTLFSPVFRSIGKPLAKPAARLKQLSDAAKSRLGRFFRRSDGAT